DFVSLAAVHAEMVAEARGSLRHGQDAEQELHLDLRYVGQEFTLQVPVSAQQIAMADGAGIRKAFDQLYEHRYAHHSPDEPVEMVNVRLGVIGKRAKLRFPKLGQGRAAAATRHREVYFAESSRPVRCPVYQRAALKAGTRITG